MMDYKEFKKHLKEKYGNIYVEVSSFCLFLKGKYKKEKSEIVLNIADEVALKEYYNKLKNVDNIFTYLKSSNIENDSYEKILNQYLRDINKFIEKNSNIDIDEETNETVACGVISVVEKKLFNIIQGCSRRIANNNGSEFCIGLLKEIESYLTRIYIYKDCFKIGERFEDSHLEYFKTPICIPTEDEKLLGTIKAIEIMPRHIKYVDDDDEESIYRLCGCCDIWSNAKK